MVTENSHLILSSFIQPGPGFTPSFPPCCTRTAHPSSHSHAPQLVRFEPKMNDFHIPTIIVINGKVDFSTLNKKGNTYYRRYTFWISTTTLGGNWIKRGTRLREWAIPLWRHRKSDHELEGSNNKNNLTLVPTAVYSSEKCNRQAKNCNRKKLSKCLLIYDLYKHGFSKGR